MKAIREIVKIAQQTKATVINLDNCLTIDIPHDGTFQVKYTQTGNDYRVEMWENSPGQPPECYFDDVCTNEIIDVLKQIMAGIYCD